MTETKLKKMGDGDKLSAPSITSMLEQDLKREIEAKNESERKGDFHEMMGYPCKSCNATGFNAEIMATCPACEGTKRDYELHYGKKDGRLFAYVKQYGMDTFKEYCKACREAETELSLSQRANRPMTRAYALPAVIDMELQARGYTPEQIRTGGHVREIAKIVQREWPYLMTTNYIF